MRIPFTGTCQCGGVHYRVTEQPIVTVVCHCLDCQKLSASAFSLSMPIYRRSFEIVRGTFKVWSRSAASGNTALCYSCSECSNRIYHENPAFKKTLRLKPGALDDTSELKPVAHIWTKRKQPWVIIPPDVQVFEENTDFIAKRLKEIEAAAD